MALLFSAGASHAAVTSPLSAADTHTHLRAQNVRGPCDHNPRLTVMVLGTNKLGTNKSGESKVPLDRQAVVKLHNQKLDVETWQTTSPKSELAFCNVEPGDYDLEVSALGYLSARRNVRITDTGADARLEIMLQADPAALDMSGAVQALPARAQKEANRAIYDLKSANFVEARKHLDRLYQLAPASAQVNFLFGYFLEQTNDAEKADSYLARAAAIEPNVRTLALLGRVQMERQHYADAQKTLEQAVIADSSLWTVHYLLADVYLREKEYEKARLEAQAAIGQARGGAGPAELILGEALLAEGRTEDGIQTLKIFLESNPDNPAATRVRDLIAKSGQPAGSAGPPENTGATGGDLALAASPATLANSWAPLGVDEAKPVVVPGVACPAEVVIHAAGERAEQLVGNISRFAAIESVVHERLDAAGNPTSRETRKFDYVASITAASPGTLTTAEFRDVRDGDSELPDHIKTLGFMSLAMIFHPAMRDDYQMTCEGLGDWRGQTTWLVHFQPRSGKVGHFAEYRIGGQSYPLQLKGRAWITAENFQIVHIESDLASPLPQLSVNHQSADYGPVHFAKRNIDLWLPENIDIFMGLNHRRYHRRHSFEHYMLFSVDSADSPVTMNGADKKPSQTP